MTDSTDQLNKSISNLELKINPEYAKLVPALTEQEYNGLKRSIQNHGLHETIKVNKKGEILDGHHRFKICNELGRNPKIEVKELANELEEKLYVIDVNFKRRHLNDFQKLELASLKQPILKEIAKKRMLAGVKLDLDPSQIFDKGRVDEQIGKDAGVSHETVRKFRIIEVAGSESIKDKLRAGKSTISKECTKIQIAQIKKQLSSEPQKIDLPNGCELLEGDFMEVGKRIPDDSIDLILTDPPYSIECLPLYEQLGIFGQRVLKEGGSLVTFIGQYNLVDSANLVEKSGLEYRWSICVKHTGHHAMMRGFGTQVDVGWKPLVWFIKGNNGRTETPGYILDFIESEPPKKVIHEWEQSTVEAEHVIKGLTVENQLLCDPFLGSGTNGIAALKLNRKFIGIEIDPQHYSNAQRRLSMLELEVYQK
jgi:site-specific DNA-methyltransferase (adenine-specific)